MIAPLPARAKTAAHLFYLSTTVDLARTPPYIDIMDCVEDGKRRFDQIKKITLIGALANLLLAAVKLAVGSLSNSAALVADGVHSLSDLLSDAVVLVGAWFSGLPADESHPYGHGKFETFAAVGVALFLIAAGVEIAWGAGVSLYEHEVFYGGPPVLFVAAASVVVKEVLFHFTRKVGVSTRSPSVVANAWHHRSDALSSLAVLAGGIGGMAGWGHADQVAAILVGIMVATAGTKIGFEALGDLSERSIGRRDLDRIRTCLNDHPGVHGWHQLRARTVGREIFMDVHVLLDPALSVSAGHEIVDQLQERIKQTVARPINFSIHMEPHNE